MRLFVNAAYRGRGIFGVIHTGTRNIATLPPYYRLSSPSLPPGVRVLKIYLGDCESMPDLALSILGSYFVTLLRVDADT